MKTYINKTATIKYINKLRAAYPLSVTKIAEATGLDWQTVDNILKAKRVGSIISVGKIMLILKGSVEKYHEILISEDKNAPVEDKPDPVETEAENDFFGGDTKE